MLMSFAFLIFDQKDTSNLVVSLLRFSLVRDVGSPSSSRKVHPTSIYVAYILAYKY